MPGSEGKQLAGLARSIDGLFSGSGRASAAPPALLTEVESGPSVEPPVFGGTGSPEVEVPVEGLGLADEFPSMAGVESFDASPDGDESTFGETPLDEMSLVESEAGGLTLVEPSLDEAAIDGLADTGPAEFTLPEASTAAAGPPAAAPPADRPPAAAPAADPPAAATRPADPAAPTETADDTADEVFDTALDQAVQAYLDGDTGRADEITALGEEFLERKELEPIARAISSLVAAAGEPADDSIMAVARPLMSPPVLARLARRLGSERNEERRAQYFAMCRSIGTPMAEAIRDDLAESTDRLARRIHCEALVEMGDSSRAVIDAMAVDENRFLVRNAVTILGDLGDERAIELITSALANPDARVRRDALRALTRLGAEDTGQFVLGLLEDPDEDVRLAAAVAAGELGVERALKPLIAMLEGTTDPDECIPLIRALGHLGDPGAVASIEKHAVRTLFSKPRTDVRIAAYRALNQIGTPHARRLLNQAVSDKDAEVKAAVKEMLHMR